MIPLSPRRSRGNIAAGCAVWKPLDRNRDERGGFEIPISFGAGLS
jgi:hypothetical protein